jgi:hypothetical protein
MVCQALGDRDEVRQSARGVPPETVRPMYDSVDTDALNEIAGTAGAGPIVVTFHFEAYSVTVSSDGVVTLSDTDTDRCSSSRGR